MKFLRNMLRSSSNVYFIITLFAYKITIDLAYAFYIYPTFSYSIGAFSFDILLYSVSLIFMLYVIVLLRFLKNSLMNIVAYILLIFAIIPSLTMITFRPTTLNAILMTFLYWFVFMNSVYFLKKLSFLRDRNYSFDIIKFRKYIYIVLTFSFLFIIYSNIRYLGFRIISTFEVYDYRSDFNQIRIPIIFDYLYLLINYSFLPVALLISLKLKSKFGLILSFFVAILLFSLDGAKTVIFNMMIIILVFIMFVGVTKITQFFIRFNLFLIFSLLISIILINYTIWPIALIYRALLIPQETSFIYIEFIDLNVALYLRDSILRFLGSPYPVPLSIFIANYESNSTNGFIGDAYANFKLLGIILYPILISVVLKIVSELYQKIDLRFYISIFMIVIWVSINASFFTWLLSGGVLNVMLISFFLKKYHVMH